MRFWAILSIGLFLIQFSNTYGAKEQSVKVGILPLAQELFPDAEILWGREFKGRMLDFKIARESGHVAIATVDDDTKKGTIYYFTSDGELLWEKDNLVSTDLKTIYDCGIEIADDGSKIMVHWAGDYESVQIQIYDTEGELFFDYPRSAEMMIVPQFLSPDGQYFFEGKWYRTPTVPVKAREYLEEPVDFSELSHFQKGKGQWRFNQVFFLSDNEVCIVADKLVPERESQKIKEEFIATIGKVVSGEIDIGLKATTIRGIRYRWENTRSPLERKIEAIRVILRKELMDVSPGMREKIRELLQKSEIPLSEKGIYCCSLLTGDLKWKLNLQEEIVNVTSTQNILLLAAEKEGEDVIICVDAKRGYHLWKSNYFFFPLYQYTAVSQDGYLFLYGGDNKFRILYINTGKEIAFKKISDGPFQIFSFHVYTTNQVGISGQTSSKSNGWYWTYTWDLDENWSIKNEEKRKGMIIAPSGSQVVGAYYSEKEQLTPKGLYCSSFIINVLQRKAR